MHELYDANLRRSALAVVHVMWSWYGGVAMGNVLRVLTTTAVVEAAKAAAAAILTSTTTLSPGLVTAAASAASRVVEELLKAASQLEKKIDVLLEAPLLAGLQFLGDAYIHANDTDAARASRDRLLDDAYESLVTASSHAEGCGEDPLFIKAVSLLALAPRTGRQSLATDRVNEMRPLVSQFLERATQLEVLSQKATAASLLPSYPFAIEHPGHRVIASAAKSALTREALDHGDAADALRERAEALDAVLRLAEGIVTAETGPSTSAAT